MLRYYPCPCGGGEAKQAAVLDGFFINFLNFD